MHPLIRDVQKAQLKKVPEIKAGYTIRVHQRIKEGGKERVQAFEGLVIKVGHGEGSEKTITVRKIVQGIGVEKTFPIHSPNITKIEVKKKAKVRRAKLFYMRERSGKSARLQERHVTDKERAEEEVKMEAMIQEAVSADEKRKKEEAAANPESAEGESEAPVETPETTPAEGSEPTTEATESDDAQPADEPTEEQKEEAPAEAEEKPTEEPKEEGGEESKEKASE